MSLSSADFFILASGCQAPEADIQVSLSNDGIVRMANQKSALFLHKEGLLCQASIPNTNGFAAKKYRHLTFIAFIFVSKYFRQVMSDVFCYALWIH
jgi:hypothetical protein